MRCPSDRCDLAELLEFALTYNGYMRLANDPNTLERVVRPVLKALEAEKVPPDWAGIDLLRGTLFFMQRRTHHWGDVPADEERRMRVLLSHIASISCGAELSEDHLP